LLPNQAFKRDLTYPDLVASGIKGVGEQWLANVFNQAGFSDFRRATETPFNIIFSARKQAGSGSGLSNESVIHR